ncbi:SDR family oxidoreductase [Sulfidibacter corallicola]|uniref:SDR family oxidoreductase n=1 Tax=Sulfidibacter corallicola TaxID=2818388 RepID=A0A8A4TNZ6_SULCO|nr:SDR family oxidoreductase [Sulfidibacter corallicola]QTD50621.1 SDR family oxidoreductase [Sulfidibacter corallicola]
MNVFIIGATGTIGRQLVNQALNKGHSVTAFVRNPSKLDMEHVRLRIVAGDVMDPASLERALPGHDAVLVALGAGAKGQVRATGTSHVVAAMKRLGIGRLVCLSSLGVGDSRANLNFFWKYLMFGLLLRKAYADHVAQERLIVESGLEWTIVRPGAFTDGDLTGHYRHGFSPSAQNLALKVSRADVAHFMLHQLDSNKYVGMTPAMSY